MGHKRLGHGSVGQGEEGVQGCKVVGILGSRGVRLWEMILGVGDEPPLRHGDDWKGGTGTF